MRPTNMPFFRIPEVTNGKVVVRRTGEFAEASDVATDKVFSRIESLCREIPAQWPAFVGTDAEKALLKLVKRQRSLLEKIRLVEPFGMVPRKARCDGTGIIATLIFGDRLRALGVSSSVISNLNHGLIKWLRRTPARISAWKKELECFSKEEIQHAAEEFYDLLGTPGPLTKMLIQDFRRGIREQAMGPEHFGLSGEWKKNLREALLRRIETLRKIAEPPHCGCGCGVRTRGRHFLPGHDAKLRRNVREGDPGAQRLLTEWERIRDARPQH